MAVPIVSDRAVPRPRVSDDLAERFHAHELVHVVAPAGSGKTTAVFQAAAASRRSLAWIALEEWHRSPGKLLADLIDALEPVAQGLSLALSTEPNGDLGPANRAALAGSFLQRTRALLVVDDCHQILDSGEAHAVLTALVKRGSPGLHVVLVGRARLPLAGLRVEADDPEAIVGGDFLRATWDEAEEILRSRNSSVNTDEAVRATDGWIAGLLFETWRSSDAGDPATDPLREYLVREVMARLERADVEALVAASVFDEIDVTRAEALGVVEARSWFATLRDAGLPAAFGSRGQMRLHPRIRELLREELRTERADRRPEVLGAAADAYEREGDSERSFQLHVECGNVEQAGRLLPLVILDVVDRFDLELAEEYLAAVPLDPEPARVVLARLTIASMSGEAQQLLSVVDPLLESGRLEALIQEEPAIGALACNVLPFRDADAAVDVLASIPQSRAADAARLILSLVRDDPGAPIPSFEGDVLDVVIARALGSKGYLQELRAGQTPWATSTGAAALNEPDPVDESAVSVPPFMYRLAIFGRAVAARDLDKAKASVEPLGTLWGRLAEAELAVRLERDPVRARAVIGELQSRPIAAIRFFRELIGTWDGAARLLADDSEAAARVLRETVASMRSGDRRLLMSTALVYLAEAEWRLGDEGAHDATADEAYAVSRRQGSLRGLLLALADFPGVLSRRVDAEASADGRWHSLGRALIAEAGVSTGRLVSPVAAHLREFGEPELVVEGRAVVRPKIRKSLELLAYLLHSRAGNVSREDVLTALWNGRDDDSTRAYLRQALRHLRDVLPEGITVEATGSMLSIQGAITSESLELEALLAEAGRDTGPGRLGYLLEMLELVGRGRFLEGSSDVLWVDDRRARIESVLADARLDAAELLLAANRHLRSVALVDEALAADPLRERAWRLRMRILDLLGDFDGVTAAYAACRRALAEIGLEPSESTTQLASMLRR